MSIFSVSANKYDASVIKTTDTLDEGAVKGAVPRIIGIEFS